MISSTLGSNSVLGPNNFSSELNIFFIIFIIITSSFGPIWDLECTYLCVTALFVACMFVILSINDNNNNIIMIQNQILSFCIIQYTVAICSY